ncbi:MAG: DnaJ domain-containing protein [Geminicoccaceae bacterium]|nr:DnaJ domain-containing protein [Geminicoccaceae bacterium]MCX7630633.1 DnaJ domain-containing protein [Geminicoccaceae bacterium]MDW8369214.1 DnaJ domain-containing protein [Geminicoccaceae bacterium]
MLAYLAAGAAALAALLVIARFLTRVSASDLAQAARTFLAVFGALAGGGLFILGRYGLAIAALAAAAMAVRSLLKARGGAEPLEEAETPASSRVETDLLTMELDRASGRVDGRVRRGRYAGRSLATLPLDELLDLLEEARRSDPPSVALIEAWLDREAPGWRQAGRAEGGYERATAAGGEMDERTALALLGLAPGASEADIQAAYRRLMAKVHPDHGGSAYLAAQLNRAREVLLRRRR